MLHHVLFLFVAPLLDLTHKIMYNKLINCILILYIHTVFYMSMKTYVPRRRVTFADCAVICFIIIAAVTLLFFIRNRENGKSVIIKYDTASLSFDLYSDREVSISSNDHTLTIIIENGSVYVRDSDCPDKYCEKTGKISSSGESIVCVPAKTAVSISAKEAFQDEEDFIAG